MKKYILIIVALVLTTAIGCKEENKIAKESDQTTEVVAAPKADQMQEVMAVHDEVMPKMGKIGRLVAALKKKLDNDEGGAIEKEAMQDLQDANKSMMDWMQGFGARFDSDEIMDGKALTDEKKQWLNEEQEKVNMVAEKMNSSIAKAEALLGKN